MQLPSLLIAANRAIAQGDLLRAAELLAEALALDAQNPQISRAYAQVQGNLSARLLKAGDAIGAQKSAERALAVDTKQVIARFNLAGAFAALKLWPQAAEHYGLLHRQVPQDREIAALHEHANWQLGETLALENQSASARKRFASVPGLRARIAAALCLPYVHENEAHRVAERARYQQALAALAEGFTPQALKRTPADLDALRWSNFLLAYQGENDCELQSIYGDLLAAAVQAWFPQWCVAQPAVRGRVLLVSSGFRQCTIGAYFGAWIGALRGAGYEVEVYQIGPVHDSFTAELIAQASRGAVLGGSTTRLAAQLRERRAELLIYPELGMDERLLALASLRLARVQTCAWGHPVTSGLPSMDGYFSCAAMEPADADSHYRERLLLLPGLGTRYLAPATPKLRARSDLGLPEGPLALIPQAPFKLLPRNDLRLIGLAESAPAVRFVLFEGESAGMTAALQTRLRAAFSARDLAPDRLIWLATTDRTNFLEICAACDLNLDSASFSGGNTTLDALIAGLPVVTRADTFMRGRQSAAMLNMLGLDAFACASESELLARASALLRNGQLQAETRARIRANLPALLAEEHALDTLCTLVAELLN